MSNAGVRRVIALFCYVNVLMNINRGFISGAPESFQAFITASLDVSIDRQNFFLGLLASTYVTSALVFSLVFGSLSVGRKPTTLITWGLSIWTLAAVASALAYHANSFYLLVLGRVLAGVGEASFQCLATPFVHRYAPRSTRSFWLGVFIASVIVGGAGGFVYGSAFDPWATGFYLEVALMLPAIALITWWIPTPLCAVPAETTSDLSAMLVQDEGTPEHFGRQWRNALTTMPFPLVALGNAAYTFTIGCFSTFSPTLLIGLGSSRRKTTLGFRSGSLCS